MKTKFTSFFGLSITAGVTAMLLGTTANASLVGSGGQLLGPSFSPPGSGSLKLGDTEDNTRSWVFAEKLGVTLLTDIAYNGHTPGGYDQLGDLETGKVAAGSLVSSYIVHFDPTSGASTRQTNGWLEFSNPIYIISRNNDLDDSDGPLGDPSVQYPGRFSPIADRGYDLFAQIADDSYSINILANGNWRVDFEAHASTGMDQLRVIETPAPASLALLGASGLIAARRRR